MEPLIDETRLSEGQTTNRIKFENLTQIDLEIVSKVKTMSIIAAEQLELDGIKIVLRYKNENESVKLIPFLGIGGAPISDTEINLVVDPNNTNLTEGLLLISRLGPHELNHLKRVALNSRGNTLLDKIITEGLAIYQETLNDINDGQLSPWGKRLEDEKETEQWNAALELLNSSDFDADEWFFSGKNIRPVWTGYKLGVSIVRNFFEKSPDVSMVEALKMKSTEILEKSTFHKI